MAYVMLAMPKFLCQATLRELFRLHQACAAQDGGRSPRTPRKILDVNNWKHIICMVSTYNEDAMRVKLYNYDLVAFIDQA